MSTALYHISSVLHPHTCPCCGTITGAEDELCDYCHEMIERCDPAVRCMRCGLDKKLCQCRKHVFHFDGCVAPFKNSGIVKKAMHRFKFRRKLSSAGFFAKNMAFCVKNEYRDINFDGVCFVPMHFKNRLMRGYNQSRVLAEGVAKLLRLPVYDLLCCNRSGVSQHSLNEKQRFKNVKGLYSARCDLSGKVLLLVDDIKTTGATLDACAKQLLAAGADGVYCVTALMSGKEKRK